MDITREDAAWDEPEETREIPPVQAPGSWDYEADVAIVGGGGAGLCAAVLRYGASVIISEKEDETGGHSQHAGAGYCAKPGALPARVRPTDRRG